jgi:hypothetical protein
MYPHRAGTAATVAFLMTFFTTSRLSADLVLNGDFESGNTAFTSQYTFAPGSNTTQGEYTVRSDPQNWNIAFAATPDHTSGAGNMLVVNGATSGDLFLWRQSVSVTTSTSYDFSAWVSTAVSGGPAVLTVEVNGIQLGSSFTAPDDPGSWSNWTVDWNSSSATTADIRIFNSNLSTFPNDFYVDDISFAVAVPEPSAFALGCLAASALLCRRFKRSVVALE